MRLAAGRLSLARGLGIALLLLGLVLCASLALGAGEVGALRVLRWALGADDSDAGFVVTELRLPRSCVAIVVGVALGVAGNLLQTVTRNPLAEPDLLGVSAASTTAVVIAILLGASVTTLQVWVAVCGAMCGCALVLAAARLRGVGDDPVRLVLAGAALKGLLTALVALVLLLDQRSADEIRFWTIGALAGRGYQELLGVAFPLLLGALLVVYLSRPLAALALGERVASGLGHRPRLTRWLTMMAVALLSGVAVALAGPIAFFGLVVPALARALVGPDMRRTLPVCVVLGPAVLLAADVAARLLVRPSELPLGVVTAVIGAPVLVAVVRAQRLPRL